MQTIIRKIARNPYTQTFLALIITTAILILLGNLMFQTNQSSNIQLGSIIGIGITLLLFFAFSLWKVNQQKQWISIWASHRIWVLLTFITLPVLFAIIFNISAFSNILSEELMIKIGNYYLPHFMFFYFWEGLLFSIAFAAHPERRNIKWKITPKQLIISLLLSAGTWSVIMFLNEIQFQWSFFQFPYLESQALFWPIIPLATIIIPISVSFILFHDFHKLSELKKMIVFIAFILLPLRTICLLPAFIIGILFWIVNQKENSYTITAVTYAFFNLLTILLNWNWVI